MMFLKRTAAAILGGAILCSGAAFAANVNTVSAEQPVADTAVSTDATAQETPAVLAERNLYYGKITEITRDEQTGAVTSLLMESEKYGAYVFHLDESTLLLDSGAGIRTTADKLAVGDGIYVFHSPIATMSIPPQSFAEAIVTNIPQDAGCAMLHTVEAVQKNEDGSVTVTTDRGGLQLTIAKDAVYGDFNGRQIMGRGRSARRHPYLCMVQHGCRVLPAQATTNHVAVAPAKAQDSMTISVDGTALDVTAKIENGTLMVPASAAGKALGLTASYEKTAEGEKVTLKNDKTTMVMDIGSDSYLVEGDMVLSYGAATVIENGVTWMPAQALADLAQADLSLATGAVAFTTAK